MVMGNDQIEITIRDGSEADASGLTDLVGGCFAEYEGCVLDLEGIDADLLHPETAFAAAGGRFWVAEAQGEGKRRIVGSIGYGLKDDGATVELKKLYVNSNIRRLGLASRLYRKVYKAAVAEGAKTIDLWSDRRFVEAHAFYLSKGFAQLDETRFLNDPSDTTEYHFALTL